MTIKCRCADWEEGMWGPDGLITQSGEGGFNFGGRKFVYCPWCSKELEEKKEEVRTCSCKELKETGGIEVLYCPVCEGGKYNDVIERKEEKLPRCNICSMSLNNPHPYWGPEICAEYRPSCVY